MQIKGKFPRAIVNTKVNGRVIETQRSPIVRKVPSNGTAVEVTFQSWEIQALDLMLGMIPEVREEKVEKIRKRIAAGEYHVNAEEIADKILDFHAVDPSL